MPTITKMPIVRDQEREGPNAAGGGAGGAGATPTGGGAAGAQSREIAGAQRPTSGSNAGATPSGGAGGGASATQGAGPNRGPSAGGGAQDTAQTARNAQARQPEPGATNAAPAPTTTDPNAARWATIERLLNQSTTGQAALRYKREHNVGVTYASGTGSFYNSGSNSMTLDTTESAESSALTFVHEMNHARYAGEGRSADIQRLSRAAYVDGMLNEEVQGCVLAIEAKWEIVAAGTPVTDSPPLEQVYKRAFDRAIAAQRTQAQAKEAGRTALKNAFTSGTVTTSNTHESYPVYYGNAWDRAHQSGGGK